MSKTAFRCQRCGEAVEAQNDMAYSLMMRGHAVICTQCRNGQPDYANMPYELYLTTDRWRDISEQCKRAAGNRCQVCNAEPPLHAHHRTYERRGYERPVDLIAVCDDCHVVITAKMRGLLDLDSIRKLLKERMVHV